VNPNRAATYRPRKASRPILRAVYYLFLVSGILGLAYAVYAVADAHAYQTIEKAKFEDVKAAPRDEPRKLASQLVQGSVIGEMEVPRLGIKDIFVEGDTSRILRHAIGHISETALPGAPGNVVLTGHRDTFFRPLRNIRQGDAITLKTLDGDFQYEVKSTGVVPPTDVQVLQPSSEPTLTLITCFPFYYVGSAPNRFIVHARQVAPLAR